MERKAIGMSKPTITRITLINALATIIAQASESEYEKIYDDDIDMRDVDAALDILVDLRKLY